MEITESSGKVVLRLGPIQRIMVDTPLVHHYDHTGLDLGFKEPILKVHSGSTVESSFFASTKSQFRAYGRAFVKNTVPNVGNLKFLAMFSSQFGFFILRENGNYKWSAFSCRIKPNGKRVVGSVIDQKIEVEKIFMQYQINLKKIPS